MGCSPPRPHSDVDISPSYRRQCIGRLSSPRSVVGNSLRESHAQDAIIPPLCCPRESTADQTTFDFGGRKPPRGGPAAVSLRKVSMATLAEMVSGYGPGPTV